MFKDPPNVAVFSSGEIVTSGKPILFVSHDEDDGAWQFNCEDHLSFDNVIVVSLKNIIDIDETVNALSDLPVGWIAWRDSKNSPWNRKSAN